MLSSMVIIYFNIIDRYNGNMEKIYKYTKDKYVKRPYVEYTTGFSLEVVSQIITIQTRAICYMTNIFFKSNLVVFIGRIFKIYQYCCVQGEWQFQSTLENYILL